MKFYLIDFWGNLRNHIKDKPCVVLKNDNWDDFGYETYFHVYYIDINGNVIELNGVKILQKNKKTTILPSIFEKLSEEFCSLGASMDYYDKVSSLGKVVYDNIFNSLNDVAMNEDIKKEFETLEGFSNSLLRNGSNALRNAKDYIENNLLKTKYTFTYATKLENAENSHKVDFSFFRDDGLPYRVSAIIGKNGTGKTQFLSDLVHDLTDDFNKNTEKFFNNKPDFGKIISFSYSAFSEFNKKTSKEQNSVIYENFGVLDENNNFNKEKMSEKLENSVKRIVEYKREKFWIDTLKEIQTNEFVDKLEEVILAKGKYEALSKLSSGQRMIFEIITNIIGNIRLNTLIVFDEPEIHLHPNAIAKLMKALYGILDEYDSFAILATHVPHVIQQIPSNSVITFDREENYAIVKKLGFESFGENLSELTNGVFETNNVFDNYKTVLKSLANNYSYESIIELFNNKLSFNARIFLRGCYDDEGDII